MMIQAVLSNPSHPEYGVATIPFPIPRDQYAHCMEMLEALEIGDAVKADCKVEKIDSFYAALKRTEMLTVNVEELNYLAKRLDSFDTGEAAQFQAMAHKLELFELKDLINLTFCCQQATVITDFSDLAAIGRDHYMNLHGGSASVDELNKLDGKGTARQLIESGSGTITPYGVVYDNGMKLEQVYDGRFFPCYYYEPNAITIAVTSKAEPEDTEHILITLPTRRQTLPCWTRFIKRSGAISETPIPPTPQRAAQVEMARVTDGIAELLGAAPEEIIYTSGASESNNLALKGIVQASRHVGKHIISTALEHSSVGGALSALQQQGCEVDLVDIRRDGTIDLEHLRELLRKDTVLVAICAVDSELGTVQPIQEIADILRDYPNCRLHVDATQAVGKTKLVLSGVDTMSIAPHKFYGLNGSGLLVKKKDLVIEPQIQGGGSTTPYRSGTPALGMATSIEKALRLALENQNERIAHVAALNRLLRAELAKYPKSVQQSGKRRAAHFESERQRRQGDGFSAGAGKK